MTRITIYTITLAATLFASSSVQAVTLSNSPYTLPFEFYPDTLYEYSLSANVDNINTGVRLFYTVDGGEQINFGSISRYNDGTLEVVGVQFADGANKFGSIVYTTDPSGNFSINGTFNSSYIWLPLSGRVAIMSYGVPTYTASLQQVQMSVPGPVAGAGIPALLALGGLVWARRRKAAVAA